MTEIINTVPGAADDSDASGGSSAQKRGGRDVSFDCMRIIACLFVIMTHTSGYGASRFALCEQGSLAYWGWLFFSVFIRFPVPLFFAISGALLLGRRDESVRTQVLRFARIAASLVFFSVLCCIVELRGTGERFTLALFLKKLYSDEWNYAYWYLYAYLAFLISLPLLRVLAVNMKREHFLYAFALILIFTDILPILELFVLRGELHLNSYLNVDWIAGDMIAAPLLGYFLSRFTNAPNPGHEKYRLVWAACPFGIAATAAACHRWITMAGGYSTARLRVYVFCFRLLTCAAVFLAVRRLCAGPLKKWVGFDEIGRHRLTAGAIRSLSACTFGIYLIHPLLMTPVFRKMAAYLQNELHWPGVPVLLVSSLAVMAICWVITACGRRIPIVRKFL